MPAIFYYSRLPKQPQLPAAVLHRVSSKDAANSIDLPGTSAGPIEGRFQLEAYAQDNDQNNPFSPSGYLSVAALMLAYRLQLAGLIDAALPDGTLIQNFWVNDEFDANFEDGGVGYVYRRVLDFGLAYQLVGDPFVKLG